MTPSPYLGGRRGSYRLGGSWTFFCLFFVGFFTPSHKINRSYKLSLSLAYKTIAQLGETIFKKKTIFKKNKGKLERFEKLWRDLNQKLEREQARK